MKHALLILAHKNVNHLKDIIQFFDEEFYVYIHIDKKSGITSEECQALRMMQNVREVESCYSVNWGGYNVLKGVVRLIQMAAKDGLADYYHLISGQDYPTKSPKEFKRYFEQRRGTEFLDYFSLPHEEWKNNGGMDRLTLYCFCDYYNYNDPKGRASMLKLDEWQRRHHIHRKISLKRYPILYGGSCWWSLTRECVQYLATETNRHPYLYRRLRFTFAPDEVYVQTILLNSPFKKQIENDNLRYIIWEHRNGNFPANIDSTDFCKIVESNKLFARKMEYPISAPLVQQLKEHCKKKDVCCERTALDNDETLPISIVMTMYNVASYLEECMDSILNQSFRDFELIVVDDGSTDESLSIMKRYSDPRIRIIENTHDYIDSLNKGLSAATGKYIARMDSDDLMAFERLSLQYNYMELHPEVDVCGAWFRRFEEGVSTKLLIKCPLKHHEIATTILKSVNPMCHPATFIRRSFLINHDLKYTQTAVYAEDLQLWVDFLKAGGIMANLPCCLHEYRQHSNQVIRTYTKQMFETSDRIYGEFLEYVMNILGNENEEIWNLFNQMVEMANRRILPISSLSDLAYGLYWNYLTSDNKNKYADLHN